MRIYTVIAVSTSLAAWTAWNALPSHAQPPDKVADQPLVTPAPQPPPLQWDLSIPAATLQTFAGALQRGDITRAIQCVAGARPHPALVQWEQEMKREKVPWPFEALALSPTQNVDINGDTAIVTQQIECRREGQDWKIVPGDPALLPQTRAPSLQMLATVLAHPEVLGAMADKAQGNTCLSNLKQLSLGLLLLAQDHNERFVISRARPVAVPPGATPPAGAMLKAAILPYVNAEQLFHCPAEVGALISYTFNPALDNIPLAHFAHPSETVLLYEGQDGHVNFRHDGLAGVAFADGHVKLVTADAAKRLRWQP